MYDQEIFLPRGLISFFGIMIFTAYLQHNDLFEKFVHISWVNGEESDTD